MKSDLPIVYDPPLKCPRWREKERSICREPGQEGGQARWAMEKKPPATEKSGA